jgi:gluconolactonase
MSQRVSNPETGHGISRRKLIQGMGVAAGVAGLAPRWAMAQAGQAAAAAQQPVFGTPPSVITNPPREYGPNAPPVSYPDPDVIIIDPMFARLRAGNSAIVRLWTGGSWLEGPAWSNQGQYLVWSDVANNRQYRWVQEDGRVTLFRPESNNSNGNCFDHQGRQCSCEQLYRRIVRHEHDGSTTIVADSWNGKHLNSPNDIAAHPDGSLWFTDPAIGDGLYEGAPDAPGGQMNQNGHLQSKVGEPADAGILKRELPANVYRADASGRVDMVVSETDMPGPNGIAFSPDYKKVYIVTRGDIAVFDVGSNGKLSNQKLFATFTVDGVRCGTDGFRVDVDGNLWCAANAGSAHLGYSGVTIWTPEGKLIGRIRLPESVSNLTFGGPKRNRIFITASSSIYALTVNTQGAAPG